MHCVTSKTVFKRGMVQCASDTNDCTAYDVKQYGEDLSVERGRERNVYETVSCYECALHCTQPKSRQRVRCDSIIPKCNHRTIRLQNGIYVLYSLSS